MPLPVGVLDPDYHRHRRTRRTHRYRLARRTSEVHDAALRHLGRAPRFILDLGTADGLMLAELKRLFEPQRAVGVEYNAELLACADSSDGCEYICADVLQVPIDDEQFDLVVATAVIEHVESPRRFLAECRRLLNADGIVVVTTPVPHMESIATRIGLLQDDQHNETLNLAKLRSYAEEAGLQVLEAGKFMFSPIGFPAERSLEKWLGPLGLRLIMANQLLVARRV